MRDNLQDKLAIIVAPNGARKTKHDHPALPMTTEEIVSEVVSCRDAGAAMVHLHARDKHGCHSLAIDDNLRVLTAVKAAVGDSMIIQLTTEAVGQYQPAQQMELITETQPEAASFAINELIPDNTHLAAAQQFFHWAAESGIISQYILYSPKDVIRYQWLIAQGILPKNHHHVLIVLGRYHQQLRSSPRDLLPFFSDLSFQALMTENKCRWATCAFGPQELQCLLSSMLVGGDVRVGFENNHFHSSGKLATSNAQQVADLKMLTQRLNIQVHDAHSFRKVLQQ